MSNPEQARFQSESVGNGGPFDLRDSEAWLAWRNKKLAQMPSSLDELRVDIARPAALTADERHAIQRACCRANMAIYRLPAGLAADKETIRRLGARLGLERLDHNLCADEESISSLRVMDSGRHTGYIPYTNRPLSWHTDGYYNTPEHRIRAIVMHCAQDAAEGGENAFLDHELVYLRLRDENPAWIAALMAPDAMTIPANVENGTELRPAQSGPVFSVDPSNGTLHMRYTARERSIEWKQDPATQQAVAFIRGLLNGEDAPIYRYRLEAGEGVICNNVLHRRGAFRDDAAAGKTRLLFRARYYDRITGTGISDCNPAE